MCWCEAACLTVQGVSAYAGIEGNTFEIDLYAKDGKGLSKAQQNMYKIPRKPQPGANPVRTGTSSGPG